MSTVRLLVGTRKGAFILTADGDRQSWNVSGPHFGGLEVFHLKASPVDPNRVYASQSSDWFGQIIYRSDDGGENWETVGNEFRYVGDPGMHLWYDGTPRPWAFKRIWHLEPSLSDPDTVYAGAEDAAIFRTTDAGKTWRELPRNSRCVIQPARPHSERGYPAANANPPVPHHETSGLCHRPQPFRSSEVPQPHAN